MSGLSVHIPVMATEVIDALNVKPGNIIVDGTLGGGGHTRLFAELVGSSGMVIGLDRDPKAIDAAEKNLRGLPIRVAQGSYSELPAVMAELGVTHVDGILLDLGLSSDQLAETDRGFSYESDGTLDLRFDTEQGEPAWRMLHRLTADEIANTIFEYGEERYSRRVARKIVETRETTPIRTASQLAHLVRSCVPRSKNHDIDPATRTFQALRIAVNGEMRELAKALQILPDCLRVGGRLAIISFHSLEDRPVKEAFRTDSRLLVLTKKPIRPNQAELIRNARARSAKLRVAERV